MQYRKPEPEEIVGPLGQFIYRGEPDSFTAKRTLGPLIFPKGLMGHHCPPEHCRTHYGLWAVDPNDPGYLQIVSALKTASAGRSNAYMYRRTFLPYCFIRLDDGRYLALNRQYKPLGMPEDLCFDYEKFAFLACPLETFDLRFADNISVSDGEVERFWIDNQQIETNLIRWRQYIIQARFLMRLQGNGQAYGRLEELLSLPEASVTTFGGRLPGVRIIGDFKSKKKPGDYRPVL